MEMKGGHPPFNERLRKKIKLNDKGLDPKRVRKKNLMFIPDTDHAGI